ncbi:hypothetical protein N1027_09995 [Herbiconiux sp. CPCC 205763]|uniref:Uncharacterized protein n=1 Tax=Herbiconiux aconitum TaxID=2970913 RepID=A0ABT2GQH1_9MICO|nr:hypothetical protein [Herbiconiux aconitum]MCS5718469.1 hypothetical protein [Herbiconiux aconitum]
MSQYPDLVWNEDFVAADPRLDVRLRIGDSVRRLFPGCIERPVADIDRAALTSRALDFFVRRLHGFGIQDVVDVITAHIDASLVVLSPSWPVPTLEGEAEPTEVLQEAELIASRALLAAEASDGNEGLNLALDWLTKDASTVTFDPMHPQSAFGRCARVRRGTQYRWLPLAFLPEVLGYAVGELAASVAYVPEARLRFAQESAAAARSFLWRFSSSILGPNDLDDGPSVSPRNVVQWIVPVDRDVVLAVQMFSELENGAGIRGEPIVKRIADGSPSPTQLSVPFAYRGVKIPPGTEVIPLLVASSPHHIASSPGGPGLASMSLDDLRWIAQTADDDLDLAQFCKDLANPSGPQMTGWEIIDRWEPWRTRGKTFFAGGASPSMIAFAPHAGEAEWELAATHTDVEVALSKLRLPVPHASGLTERVETDVPTVVSWRTPATDGAPGIREVARELNAWVLHVGQHPLAVTWSDDWPANQWRIVMDVAAAMSFGVAQVEADWNSAHTQNAPQSHVLEFVPQSGFTPGPLFSIIDHEVDSDGVHQVSAGLNFSVLESFHGRGADQSIRDEMATLIQQLLRSGGAAENESVAVARAWRAAPPTLTFQIINTITQHNDLRSPVDFNESLSSEIDRAIAGAVKHAGVAPGTYGGEEAKRLDREILSCAALDALRTKLAQYDRDDLIQFGMQQLERGAAERDRELRGIRRSQQSLALTWDPVVTANRIQSDAFLLRRANEVIIEVTLRENLRGDARLNDTAWASLMAAANAFVEATIRSEGIHLQVTPVALEISDLYEIAIVDDDQPIEHHVGAPYRLDQHQLSLAMAAEQFREETEGDRADPTYTDIDAAMVAAYGIGSIDLYAVFGGLATWPAGSMTGDVAIATPDQVIRQVLNATELGTDRDAHEKIQAALTLLTSNTDSLAETEWQPWRTRQRKRRLLAQPIPELEDGTVVIAPHYLLTSFKVYQSYLSQGVLPWTQPQPPKDLDQALERFRDARNKFLEEDVSRVLVEYGWSVETNIRETKPGRLNLDALSSEIDAVAGKAGKRTLLLLEAKDPASVHALSQMRAQLDDFYLDRKNKPAYATQLERKRRDLVSHEVEIATALKLPTADQSFEVRPIFVTRHPIPAGYVGGPFEVLTINDLRDALAADKFD